MEVCLIISDWDSIFFESNSLHLYKDLLESFLQGNCTSALQWDSVSLYPVHGPRPNLPRFTLLFEQSCAYYFSHPKKTPARSCFLRLDFIFEVYCGILIPGIPYTVTYAVGPRGSKLITEISLFIEICTCMYGILIYCNYSALTLVT